MKIKTFLLFLFIITITYSQVSVNSGVYFSKEFSKDISLFKSKKFLMNNVLKVTENITEFTITPLAASSSGELTTLIYKCEEKSKKGLILGFYGNYWNKQGVVYQGFGFKNFSEKEATEFLTKIETSIENHKEFLKKDDNNNNIIFSFNDINVMVYTISSFYKIRLFWNGFDSTWGKTSFERSKKRFEKKSN